MGVNWRNASAVNTGYLLSEISLVTKIRYQIQQVIRTSGVILKGIFN